MVGGMGAAAGAGAGSYSGGGGGGGGMGGGGGGMWGMVAQYAMQELDREKEDRAALFQGIKGAMDDNAWIMAHYPNFYSTPQVQTQAVANPTPNAPSQQAANMSPVIQQQMSAQADMNKANSTQEFEKWKIAREEAEAEKNRSTLLQGWRMQNNQQPVSSGSGYQQYLNDFNSLQQRR